MFSHPSSVSTGRPRFPFPVPGLFLLSLALASWSGAQDRSERFIGPGVRLLRWTDTSGPQALQAVEVDTSQPFIRLGVSLGQRQDGPGRLALGLEPLSRQAERLTRPERYPIAGVNGDFFYYPNARQPGISTNAAVLDGELIRTPFDRSCLIIDASGVSTIRIMRFRGQVALPDGRSRALDSVNHPRGANQLVLYTPRYGSTTRTVMDGTEVYLEPERFPLRHGETHRARVSAVQQGVGSAPIHDGCWILSGSGPAGAVLKTLAPGDTLEIRAELEPALAPGDQVLGGGPRLVRGGKVSVEPEGGSLGDGFARARHPRTAIGFAGRNLYLVVVDGRQPGHSLGMTLQELAQVMVDLGCTDALNMDGGGSTTLWARGAVRNRPSDGRERPVANGLLVFSTAPKGEPVRLAASPDEIRALAGAEVPLSAAGEDRYYNPVPLPDGGPLWTVDPALGVVRNGRFVAAEGAAVPAGQEYAAGVIEASAGAARGTVPVRVYPRPARVEIAPAAARLGMEVQSQFRVRAYDAQGLPLALPAEVTWEASPGVGTVDAAGTLSTGAAPAAGALTATVNGVRGTAQVEVVESAAGALDDFENDSRWKLSVLPAETAGAVSVVTGPARSGKRALRLEYDFTSGTGTRAVYALGDRALGRPLALKLWAYGDGQGAWLRARLRDANGMAHTLDLARRVDWKGEWRELRAPVSEDIPGPITLEAIYVVEPDPSLKPKGAILVDDLGIEQEFNGAAEDAKRETEIEGPRDRGCVLQDTAVHPK
jgi:hypothetical protein